MATTAPVLSDFLASLRITETNAGGFDGEWIGSGPELEVITPIDGSRIATVQQVTEEEYDRIVDRAHEAFLAWRRVPAPSRGELVRQLGNRLREVKHELGQLVTLEMGKILAEGEGEVQEMIDICDFAIGLSRQLYGLTMQSERPDHRMFEQWHPLGVVGVISAFNFPVAVWSWNTAIAAVCGDSVLWKPASKTPLTAIACTKIAAAGVPRRTTSTRPSSRSSIGKGSTVGDRMLHDRRVPLVSATGSCQVGYRVGEVVGSASAAPSSSSAATTRSSSRRTPTWTWRCRRSCSARWARPASAAPSRGGSSCTSRSRDELVGAARAGLRGHPRSATRGSRTTLMGPLVTTAAVEDLQNAIERVQAGGRRDPVRRRSARRPGLPGRPLREAVHRGGEERVRDRAGGDVRADPLHHRLRQQATPRRSRRWPRSRRPWRLHNGVPQGLSSAIFTEHVREAEYFLSHRGSDCGIANVNIGTSGAEIGGAFGGEKETGGGRESGSDAWKVYMRRQTNTVNWSTELPLAQGIKFGG